MPDTWVAEDFRTLGLMRSGLAALPWCSHSSCLLTWPVDTVIRGVVAIFAEVAAGGGGAKRDDDVRKDS